MSKESSIPFLEGDKVLYEDKECVINKIWARGKSSIFYDLELESKSESERKLLVSVPASKIKRFFSEK